MGGVLALEHNIVLLCRLTLITPTPLPTTPPRPSLPSRRRLGWSRSLLPHLTPTNPSVPRVFTIDSAD